MARGAHVVRRIVGCVMAAFIGGELTVSALTGSVWHQLALPPVSSATGAWGQDRPPGPDVLGAGAAAGIRVQRPGEWTAVAFEAMNPTDQPATLSASFHFRQQPTRKWTRQVWLPPQARRLTLCPVLVPEADADGAHELICTVMDLTSGTPRLLPDSGGMLQRSTLLSSTFDPVTTVLLPDSELLSDQRELMDEVGEAVIAARLAGGQTRRLAEVGRSLPPDLSLYFETMDQLIVSNDTLFADAATVEAVRRWLYNGGNLWIMLDRVELDDVAGLLGDDWNCTAAGRVELTQFELEPARPGLEAGIRREFEQPVAFVRVLLEDARVLYRLDGWPAAFVQDFGRGRVIFTTLGARGWTRPVAENELQGTESLYYATQLGTDELRSLALEMYTPRPQHPVAAEDLRGYLAKRIGYQIVARTPVLVILGVFVVALAGSSTWLWRVGRQPALAAIAPLLALAAAIPIAAMGLTTQRAIPPTVAEAQIVQVVPRHDVAYARGTMAFYHQAPTTLEASGQGTGVFVPDAGTSEGTIQEMVWQDGDRWQWSQVRVPASVVTGRFEQGVRLDAPLEAELTFTARGVEGRMSGGPWQRPEDPLILAPQARAMAARWGSEGRFQGGSADILGPEQFVGAGILSDEQQRRQELLRATAGRRGLTGFPHEPMLLFWGEPLPHGFQFAESLRRTGVALVQVPLAVRRPATSGPILIPATFLPYRTVAGPGGRGVAATYRAATGEWVRSTSSSDTWLRIQVPDVLRPLRVDRLRGQLVIRAPSRRLDIAVAVGQQAEVLESHNQPSGTVPFVIERPDLLALDDEGGLLVGLLLSETLTPDAAGAEWKVDDLRFTADATIE